MDYFKEIKKSLEENDCSKILKAVNYDKDFLSNFLFGSNILFSNNSYVFLYLEQAATFLAQSLNVLCKSSDNQLSKQLQKLSINAAPIGRMKKCILNNAGTFVLLVYDKSISVIELPSKWGKFEQYNGGNLNTICKSISLNLGISKDVVDAIWHTKSDLDLVVCLTNDNHLRYFNINNSKVAIKDYRLANEKCIKIEMGSSFEYNDKIAYPIFILKSNGSIECMIEYESSKNFENFGELEILPFNIDYENIPIISFMCLNTQPNCLVVLLEDGTIHHCIFLPNTKGMESADNLYQDNDNADDVLSTEAILYVVESIKLNENNPIDSIQFLKDPSSSIRYFIFHESGVHSVIMPWLEDIQDCLKSQKSLDLIEFDDLNLSEVSYAITTKPFSEKYFKICLTKLEESVNLVFRTSSSFLIGLTVLNGFGNTSPILIGLANNGKFVSSNIKLESKQLSILDVNKETNQADQFTNYIRNILKRESNLPIIKADNIATLSEEDLNLFLKQTINLIKFEYVEKQKLVIVEFQRRSKLLKQQEQIQFDIVKEINSKLDALKDKKEELKRNYEKYFEKQKKLSDDLEKCVNGLLTKRSLPMTQQERKIDQELKDIKYNLKNYEFQIIESKKTIKLQDISSPLKQPTASRTNLDLEPSEIDHLRNLIKNQAEKIKTIITKTEKLKLVVSV